jgi:hypothetical protein
MSDNTKSESSQGSFSMTDFYKEEREKHNAEASKRRERLLSANPMNAERERHLVKLDALDIRGHIADHFAKYADPFFLGRYLMRYELMKRIIGVHGSIVECGMRSGDGLFQWYWLSKFLEPLARRRVAYGFDTFEGLAGVTERDGKKAKNGDQLDGCAGETKEERYQEVRESARIAQARMVCGIDIADGRMGSRFLWPQIVVNPGDFMITGEEFLRDYPHVIIALLYLDFDIYAPTKKAIELFLPRMPKGAIIAFDEIDHPDWPGETIALEETIGIRNLRLERFSWEPSMGFAVLS